MNKQKLKQKIKDLLLALLLNVIVYYIAYLYVVPIFQSYLDVPVKVHVIAKEVKAQIPVDEPSIQEKIIKASLEAGIEPYTALRIASCESKFNPLAKSKISTAKGLYQFIDGTWKNYCQGDVFNEDDNIACFVKLYPSNKSWWECK